jgi:tetratricopeptide (TPR) repeat protein
MKRAAWSRKGHGIPLLATAIALAFAGLARAESQGTSFDEANRSYAAGHYAEAAADFESLARTHGWSAPILYDLGNTYAQQGQVGRSILDYERAHLLAPRDPDITANLAYVRATAGLPVPVQAWWETVARWLTPTTWTGLAVSGLWLAWAGFLAARKWRWRRLATTAALAAAVLGGTAVTALLVLDRDLDRAVVVETKSAPIRVSPFDTAASETSVSEGEEVAVIGRHGDFVRVRDGQGRVGWVQSAAVQPIVPRRS